MAGVEKQKKEKDPSVLRTFRLSSALDNALTSSAVRQKVGKNALVVSVLNKYIEWDSKALEFGYVYIPGELLAHLLAGLDKEAIESIANVVSKSIASSLGVWYGSADLDSMLKYFETSIKYSGAGVRHRVIRESNVVKIITYQPFDEKGAAYVRAFNISFVENILGYPPKIVEHANSIETIIEVRDAVPVTSVGATRQE